MDKYTKFKHLLEYFVSHLEWVEHQDTSHPGFATYIRPILDNFKKSGQGWKDDSVQEQVKDWADYNGKVLCINIDGRNYQSTGCYLNKKGTWYNIRPLWENAHVAKLCLTKEEKANAKKEQTYTLDDLGLFDNDAPNCVLRSFFDNYQYMCMGLDGISIKCCKLLSATHNLVLTGAPGTGKTYLAKEMARAMGCTSENKRCQMVQFHPSYDYTDFVEGLRPTPPDANGNIGFKRVDGVFKEFCKRAIFNKSDKYVFIIDEINRGEISKIFGELFYCIDSGYRGENGRVKTQYQNLITDTNDPFCEGFYVPENVYIIGTMNDIDRSVESMDFAMRRRFAWKEIKASENTGMLDELHEMKDEVVEVMNRLNAAIWDEDKNTGIEGLSEAYHIGGAYFSKLKLYLNDGHTNKKEAYILLWENHLKGVLFEYLRGMEGAREHLKKLESAYYQSKQNDTEG